MKATNTTHIKPGYIINTHGMQIHEDSCVMLNEPDRQKYGGARFVDALTFVKAHPLVRLQEGFIMGFYHYEGATFNRPDTFGRPDHAPKMSVPECYAINGWE